MSNSVLKLKKVVGSLFYHFGIFDVMRFFQRKRINILMYHRFSLKKEPFKITAEDFKRQIEIFRKKYNIIPFEMLSSYLGEKIPLPSNPLIITIDDGYHDNYSIAYPILKEYALPATIFLTTDFITHKAWLWTNKLEYILKNSSKAKFSFPIGNTTLPFKVTNFSSWHKSQLTIFNHMRTIGVEKDQFLEELAHFLKVEVPDQVTAEFQPLDWSQIIEMQENGISFGSHTCSHPILSTISGNELKREISDSKKEIETKLGKKVDLFCYPNGQLTDINDETLHVVEKSGYLFAVTAIVGFNHRVKSNRYLLKRYPLTTSNTINIIKTLTMSF